MVLLLNFADLMNKSKFFTLYFFVDVLVKLGKSLNTNTSVKTSCHPNNEFMLKPFAVERCFS